MPEADPGLSDAPEFLGGRLLIAMPGIGDPRFERAVILVCMHTADKAMGLRLNLPFEDLSLSAMLTRLGVEGRPRNPGQAVLAGGPVEMERGHVLHTDDYASAGATEPVAPGLAVTATRDVLDAITAPQRAPQRSVLALGYAGWGAGQLEAEIRESVWLTAPADLELVFDEDHEAKWLKALGRLGVAAHHLSGVGGRA